MKSYNSYWKEGNSFDRRAQENCYVVYAVKKDQENKMIGLFIIGLIIASGLTFLFVFLSKII